MRFALHLSAFMVVLALLAATVAPLQALAQETLDPDVATEQAPTEVVPTPSPTPSPTPTPTIAPTMAPTLEPTLPPTVAPTIAPTLPPTQPAAPTATVVPTVTPSATVTPTPSPTVTPIPTPRSRAIAPASVAQNGRISGCKQSPASDQLQPGGTLTATCNYSRGLFEDGARLRIDAPISSTPNASSGWKASLSVGGYSTGFVSTTTYLAVPTAWFSDGFDFTISLQAPSGAVVTSAEVTTTVTVERCFVWLGFCTPTSAYTTLGASVAVPNMTGGSLSCAPVGQIDVSRNTSKDMACTLTAPANLNGLSMKVERVTVPAPATGWKVTSTEAFTSGADGSITLTPNISLAANATWKFTITLTPSCTTGTSASRTMTTLVAPTNGSVTGSSVAGPSGTYTARAVDSSSSVSASVTSGNIGWSVNPSFNDQVKTGSLTYSVTGTGCTGWSVSVSASPFAYSGSAFGSPIPANNFLLTGAGAPTATTGTISGVTRSNTTGALGQTRKVLSAAAGSGIGTYQQKLDLSLTIPGNTSVGTYTSTITISTSAAP